MLNDGNGINLAFLTIKCAYAREEFGTYKRVRPLISANESGHDPVRLLLFNRLTHSESGRNKRKASSTQKL